MRRRINNAQHSHSISGYHHRFVASKSGNPLEGDLRRRTSSTAWQIQSEGQGKPRTRGLVDGSCNKASHPRSNFQLCDQLAEDTVNTPDDDATASISLTISTLETTTPVGLECHGLYFKYF